MASRTNGGNFCDNIFSSKDKPFNNSIVFWHLASNIILHNEWCVIRFKPSRGLISAYTRIHFGVHGSSDLHL